MGPQWDRETRSYSPGTEASSLAMVETHQLKGGVGHIYKEPYGSEDSRARLGHSKKGHSPDCQELQSSFLGEEERGARQEEGRLTRLVVVRQVVRHLVTVCLLLLESSLWWVVVQSLEVESSHYLLLFLLLPTLASSAAWLCDSVSGRSCATTCSTLLLLLFSLPSPLLLHLAHLYEVARGRSPRALNRILTQAMLCHSLTGSLPLFLTGLYILKQAIHIEEDTIAVNLLHNFLESSPLFLPALLLSFVLMVMGIHRYNEASSSSLVSVLVSLPMTVSTLLARLTALAVILCFQPPRYSLLLLSALTALNMGAGLACRLGGGAGRGAREEQEGGAPAAVDCLGIRCSSLLSQLPGHLTRAAASIVHPLGYCGDTSLGQGHVRGAALLLANYVVVMTGLGGGLALSLTHRVPNSFQGVEMASMGVQLEVPETEVLVKSLAGLDIKVRLPVTHMDLGGMETMQASLNIDPWLDLMVALAAAIMLVVMTLPATMTRAVLLGLDCVVVRREEGHSQEGHSGVVRREEGHSLARARQGLGPRLTVALVCGLLGALVSSLAVVAAVAAVTSRLTS